MNWQDNDKAHSHFIASPDEEGLNIHLRSYPGQLDHTPILFVHGATYASRMYDIPVPGMSWLKYSAHAGFPSYAIDIRGYGKSQSARMFETSEPYATAAEAVRDIDQAVEWICQQHDCERVHMVGGSWGSITSSLYASSSNRIESLVLYAPIYSNRNDSWVRLLAEPGNPDRYNAVLGAHRRVDLCQTRERWDEEIPKGEKWRDEAVLLALVEASIADSGQSPANASIAAGAGDHFQVPNGTLTDLWKVFAEGQPLYNPAAIRCPTMLIRGGGDLTSTRDDALGLLDALAAKDKHYVEIANGGHFISAERSGPLVFAAVERFLRHRFA